MADGIANKYLKDHLLLFDSKSVSKQFVKLVQEVIAQTGENIKIKRFQRFEVGGE